MANNKSPKKFNEEEKILAGIIIVLAIALVSLVFYVFSQGSSGVAQNQQEVISVEIIEITADCDDCFEVGILGDQLAKQQGVEVDATESINYNSARGTDVVEKYGINNVPALVIVSKDIDKITTIKDLFRVGEDFAIFDKAVPSINLQTGKTSGLVQFKEIQPVDCIECISASSLRGSFESLGIKIKDYEFISASTDAGKQIIEENELSFAPALLISKDIDDYWWAIDQIKPALTDLGEYYLFSAPLAPYVELDTGDVKGVVSAIYLENSSCTDCFNTAELGDSFREAGVYLEEEKTFDISSSEGKSLLNKYNITAIPTVILSKEITDYDQIKQALTQVGTFESDGSFVFRKLDSLNAKYQEIKS